MPFINHTNPKLKKKKQVCILTFVLLKSSVQGTNLNMKVR